MTKIEEIAKRILEVAHDNTISGEHKLFVTKAMIQGEIDDILKLTHNIRTTSLPFEKADRLHELEIKHGIYTMKKYMIE